MKRCILLLALIFGFQLTMTAQKSNSKRLSPKEDIHVNREYDENGNLVKFDSVYSYSWSGDSALVDSIYPNPFGNHFNFTPDSSFFDNSPFSDFDQLFFGPFSKKQDSLLKHFDLNGQLRKFNFKEDTMSSGLIDIDDFFRRFYENNPDSNSIKQPGNGTFSPQPKSQEEIMKMIQKHMREIEEQQRKLFGK